MRPRGTIRLALAGAFAERGPLTWREAAEAAQVGYRCAQRTVENMVRGGDLVHCGEHKPPGATVTAGIYELAPPREAGPHDGSLDDLAAVTARWAAFV